MQIVLAFCLAFGSMALAAEEGFESRKKMIVDSLTEREKTIGEAKTCAMAAQNQEEMKKCMENRSMEVKMEREKMIDQKIKHLEERKAKLEARKNEKMEEKK